MCGIYAITGSKNAATDVLVGLKKLEYRGYDSWGITVPHKNKLLLDRRVGKIGDSKTNLPASSTGLGHTRWATHGGVTVANSHPHLDCTKSYAVVHNGIVENYLELKSSLKNVHRFSSQTDTEVLVHLVEEFTKTMPFTEAVAKVFQKTKGLSACIFYSLKDQEFIAVKNGSPLIIGIGKNKNLIASDSMSLASHTDQVIYLEDGEIAAVSREQIKILDLNLKQKTPKINRLKIKEDESNLKDYKHFTLKEIEEQPQKLKSFLDNHHSVIVPFAGKLKKYSQLTFVGCGTAGYAALSAKYYFSKVGVSSDSLIGSESDYFISNKKKESLVVFLSQSGETIDIVTPAKQIKSPGGKIGAVVNMVGSTLDRLADIKLNLDVGPEISVISTKVFTAKLASLFLVSQELAGKSNSAKKLLQKTIKNCLKILSPSYRAKYLKPLIKLLSKSQHLFILGKNISYPLALEAALKLKESCYIHAEGFASGELKHGVIALISKNTPCIFINPKDETYSDVLNSAAEVKARGGYIIGISSVRSPIYDYYLPVGDSGLATNISNILVIQLLSYYLAIKKGLDPDKPRNLAKSVTVK